MGKTNKQILNMSLTELGNWFRSNDTDTNLRMTCIYCGAGNRLIEPDHVIPKSRGGTNDRFNIVPACVSCNREKHDRTPEEWLGIPNSEFYFGSPRHIALMKSRMNVK
jgi:hypothetical protein